MTFKKLLSTFLIAALIAATMPSQVWASEEANGSLATAPVNLRAAVNQAAVRLAKETPSTPKHGQARQARAEAASPSQGSGGGGGKMMAIMLVTTALSAVAGYAIYKEMKRETKQITDQQQQ